MGHRLFAMLFLTTAMVACGGSGTGADSGAQGDNGLPKPGAVSGSVTGMPNPGVVASRPQARAAIELPGDSQSALPEGTMEGVAKVEDLAVEDPGTDALQAGPTLPEPIPEADAGIPAEHLEHVDQTVPSPQP